MSFLHRLIANPSVSLQNYKTSKSGLRSFSSPIFYISKGFCLSDILFFASVERRLLKVVYVVAYAYVYDVAFHPFQAAKSLEEKLKSSGVPHEVYIYPGCAHAFMNVSPEGIQRRKKMGMSDEDPAAVELAWSRFATWMGKHLHSP